MTRHYIEHYMACLGPYVSSVFFVLVSHASPRDKPAAYVKSMDISLAQIAQKAGISRRKGINSLKVLKDHWIIIQRAGKGRGNTNRYYFLPSEVWIYPVKWRETRHDLLKVGYAESPDVK